MFMGMMRGLVWIEATLTKAIFVVGSVLVFYLSILLALWVKVLTNRHTMYVHV